ncbi:hypothetical protein U1Q18_030392, partial [Sarracenia purpurea var. burkii]
PGYWRHGGAPMVVPGFVGDDGTAGSADVRRDGKGGLGIYSLFEKDDKKNLREVFKRGTEEGEVIER